MDATMTLELIKPVTSGKGDNARSYTSLDLHEPTVGELIASTSIDNRTERNTRLIALVSGVPDQVVRQLAVRDYLAAMKFLDGFFEASPTTGDSSESN